ncbi:MAG TPA: GspMb/PilO family protein [Candidatus Cybelea sp.]|nr:GspMb/PilO family protein [Candidatus Cybelea sp.]
MNATRAWAKTKIVIMAALGVLLAADVALGFLLWRNSSESPEHLRGEIQRLELQAKLREAELARDQKIRASMPHVGRDCDRFYEDTFLLKETGYSAIEADLNSIADKAGLRLSGATYKESEVKDRGVTQIVISTGVDGNYASIIQFINGLEQSKNFYLLNDLRLTSASAGAIKLQLELRTFFRS